MTRNPIQSLLVVFIAVCCLGATAYMAFDVVMHPRGRVGPAPSPLWPAPAFTMLDQDGQTITHEDLRGKVWVAGFFFTSCPLICPQMNLKMQQLQEDLSAYGAAVKDVRLVSFSIDPATDRPKVLKDYSRIFEAKPGVWMFLTHPKGDRDAVWDMVGINGFKMTVTDTPDDPMNPIEHTPRFVLVDRAGMVRDSYDSREDADMAQLLRDTRAVAAEAPAKP